jgi:hypothetical protein
MRKASKKPLLTLIEAGSVNDTPVLAPAATVVASLDWSGDNENGYVGTVNGIKLYEVKVLDSQRPLHFIYSLGTRAHYTLGEASYVGTIDEAKARCEADYVDNGGSTAARKALDEALALIKAAGYRVSKLRAKPKRKPKSKDRVGPTFVCEFADGEVTRMSTFTSLKKLDWDRGERLSQAAWEVRWRARERKQQRPYWVVAPVPPAIVAARFEQDGVVLARRPNDGGVS